MLIITLVVILTIVLAPRLTLWQVHNAAGGRGYQSLIDANPKAIEGTLRSIYKATAYMKKNRAYGVDYMRKFTGEKDDKVVELDYNDVLSKRPTSAKIERPWLEAWLALAALGGITDLPPIDEIFTDRFSGVNGD